MPVNRTDENTPLLDTTKERYVNLSCQPRPMAIQRVKVQIQELENSLVEYQKAIITRIRDIDIRKAELFGLEMIRPSTEVKGIEFDKLLEHPDIEDIVIEGSRISVTTSMIDITYAGKTYEIGKFIIYLSTDGRAGWLIQFKNLTKSPGNHPHPHVDTNGSPCLGNIKECMPQMLGNNQFAVAIMVAIQYLKSYVSDPDNKPYIQIHYWPEKVIPVLTPTPVVIEEEADEISGGVDRAEGVAEEDRTVEREVGQQRENTGG